MFSHKRSDSWKHRDTKAQRHLNCRSNWHRYATHEMLISTKGKNEQSVVSASCFRDFNGDDCEPSICLDTFRQSHSRGDGMETCGSAAGVRNLHQSIDFGRLPCCARF